MLLFNLFPQWTNLKLLVVHSYYDKLSVLKTSRCNRTRSARLHHFYKLVNEQTIKRILLIIKFLMTE